MPLPSFSFFFFFNDTATTEIYTLSLHDALPISIVSSKRGATASPTRGTRQQATSWTATSAACGGCRCRARCRSRSEEHTSELQSPCNLVCRLLLEKKKKQQQLGFACCDCTTVRT